MTPLLLGLPWAREPLLTPTPGWVHLVAGLGALAVAVWTSLMGVRQARKRKTRLVPFPPRRR
jgi:hypothetical protein